MKTLASSQRLLLQLLFVLRVSDTNMIQLRKSKGLLKNDVTKIGGGGYPKLVTKSEIGGNELGGAGEGTCK